MYIAENYIMLHFVAESMGLTSHYNDVIGHQSCWIRWNNAR